MRPIDRLIAAAITREISHGDFRLYVILEGAAIQAKAHGEYFPVTLEGLLALHPGIAGRSAGASTVIKQVASLRRAGLLDTQGAIHRDDPRRPVLVKVLDPAATGVNLASVVNTQ